MKTVAALTALLVTAGAVAACSSKNDHDMDIWPVDEPPSVGLEPGFGRGPQPEFGPILRQADPPPSITGGTLAVTSNLAVAADPDRDKVYVVDLESLTIRFEVALPRHSEPGRVAVDDSGRAFVVLRRAGDVAQIDLATGALTLRKACSTPRGIAFDRRAEAIHVACASGELVTLPTSVELVQGRDPGNQVRRRDLGVTDLRDVVVTAAGTVHVTRFRSAERITVVAEGQRTTPSGGTNLAWRAIAAPDPGTSCDGGQCPPDSPEPVVVEQEPTPGPVRTGPGGYGGHGDGRAATVAMPGCQAERGIITTRLSLGRRGSIHLPLAVLPVDLATNGREYAVVAAGNAYTPSLPQIFVIAASELTHGDRDCVGMTMGSVPGQAIAAAYDKYGLVIQTREPSALHILSTRTAIRVTKTIKLAEDVRGDTGHQIFHANAGGNIACASCHAEGADDGLTWNFADLGPRRTPSLMGTLAHTEPFHWDGDMKDMRTLVDKVFVERMSGPKVSDEQLDVLKGFLYGLPAPPKLRAKDEASARGQVIFQERCSSCHGGPLFTNNASVDVGTGGTFQVPSLVGLAWRAPFFHDGCARTLQARFDPRCSGGNHGVTADLGERQRADLVKFLETL